MNNKVILELDSDDAELLLDLLNDYPHCMGAQDEDEDMDSDRLARILVKAIDKFNQEKEMTK